MEKVGSALGFDSKLDCKIKTLVSVKCSQPFTFLNFVAGEEKSLVFQA